jgi:hypothetical protein
MSGAPASRTSPVRRGSPTAGILACTAVAARCSVRATCPKDGPPEGTPRHSFSKTASCAAKAGFGSAMLRACLIVAMACSRGAVQDGQM